jgi:hypothetical protein
MRLCQAVWTSKCSQRLFPRTECVTMSPRLNAMMLLYTGGRGEASKGRRSTHIIRMPQALAEPHGWVMEGARWENAHFAELSVGSRDGVAH